MCHHHGQELCATYHANQGRQGAGQGQLAGTVHTGASEFMEKAGAAPSSATREGKAHPMGVRARGSGSVLNLCSGPACLGGPHGPWGGCSLLIKRLRCM